MDRVKVWLDGDSYMYPGGEYVRQKLADDSECTEYRYVTPKPGRRVLLCRTSRGKWKAVSLLRHLNVDLRGVPKEERLALKLARKLRETMGGQK